jgi:hypothetical protein
MLSPNQEQNNFATLTVAGLLDFAHRPEFYKLENTAFWKLGLFPSSDEGRETPTPETH